MKISEHNTEILNPVDGSDVVVPGTQVQLGWIDINGDFFVYPSTFGIVVSVEKQLARVMWSQCPEQKAMNDTCYDNLSARFVKEIQEEEDRQIIECMKNGDW